MKHWQFGPIGQHWTTATVCNAIYCTKPVIKFFDSPIWLKSFLRIKNFNIHMNGSNPTECQIERWMLIMQRCANFVNRHQYNTTTTVSGWMRRTSEKQWCKNSQQQSTEYYFSMAKWDENWINDFICRIHRGQFISNRIRVNKCDNHKLCKMPRVHVHSFNVHCLYIVYCIQYTVYSVHIWCKLCVFNLIHTHKFDCGSEGAQVEKTLFDPSGCLRIHCIRSIQSHSNLMHIWFKLTRGWTN